MIITIIVIIVIIYLGKNMTSKKNADNKKVHIKKRHMAVKDLNHIILWGESYDGYMPLVV